MSFSLSDRFRNAIQSNDLPTAKRVFHRAQMLGKPIDIRNQLVVPGDAAYQDYASGRFASNKAKTKFLRSFEALGDCPALSATQFQLAASLRIRERNRDVIKKPKSSIAIAIENNASLELIDWLLDMGHERGTFSRDDRGCTTVSLAAQFNRTDVIEACCIDAVAHAASLHHQKSLSLMTTSFSRSLAVHYDEGDENTPKEDESEDVLFAPDGNQSNSIQLEQKSGIPASAPFANKSSTRDETVGEENDIVGVTMQRLLDCPDELGRTALVLASMKGFEEATKLLIELGANLEITDYEGNGPLHYASAYNQLLIVQLLIEYGCSFTTRNSFGFMASEYSYNDQLASALEGFAREQIETKRVKTRAQKFQFDEKKMARAMASSSSG